MTASSSSVCIFVERNIALEQLETLTKDLAGQLYDVMSVSVLDIADSIRLTDELLAKAGVEDENPIWKRYDSRQFSLVVDIDPPFGGLAFSLKEHFADVLAARLSGLVQGRVIVCLRQGTVPLVIYRDTEALETFDAAAYFMANAWIRS